MTLVERIKKISDVPLYKLETELGFSHDTIRRWDNNEPSSSKLLAVAKRLNVSMEYLLTGIEPTYNENAVIIKPDSDVNDKTLQDFIKLFKVMDDNQKAKALGYIIGLLDASGINSRALLD